MSLIENFFALINYSTWFWHLYDNYLPLFIIRFLNEHINLFEGTNIVCETICLLYININSALVYLLNLLDVISYFNLGTTSVNALCMSLKFLLCIAFLIFARGGIPRFRFDYLTKLGWIRFLSLVLLSILIEILILSMM